MKTTYVLNDNDLLLDVDRGVKNYVLKIRDLPDEDKPREKMIAHGAASLSTVELLAIVLSNGNKKEGVLELASRMIKEYGERALVNQIDPKKIADELDVPLVKAFQVVACGELGRRFFQRNANGMATIRTAEDVYNYLGDMKNFHKEQLRGIYLNTHHRVIHDEVISIGTINSNLIHPREVFKPAIEYGAAAVILAHNHPSGIVTASQADIDITKQLVEVGKLVGINLIDHVIIGRGQFASVEIDYN